VDSGAFFTLPNANAAMTNVFNLLDFYTAEGDSYSISNVAVYYHSTPALLVDNFSDNNRISVPNGADWYAYTYPPGITFSLTNNVMSVTNSNGNGRFVEAGFGGATLALGQQLVVQFGLRLDASLGLAGDGTNGTLRFGVFNPGPNPGAFGDVNTGAATGNLNENIGYWVNMDTFTNGDGDAAIYDCTGTNGSAAFNVNHPNYSIGPLSALHNWTVDGLMHQVYFSIACMGANTNVIGISVDAGTFQSVTNTSIYQTNAFSLLQFYTAHGDGYSISNLTMSVAPVTFAITANAGANGTISPSGVTNVDYGSNVNYTMTPNSGYKVADVEVDGSSVGAVTNYGFTSVIASHVISATFASATPASTNLSYSINNGQLILNWPNGLGWNLQVQTNALSAGLSTNWKTISAAISPYTNAISQQNQSVFYRLTYP
jgi:hypothetical protein